MDNIEMALLLIGFLFIFPGVIHILAFLGFMYMGFRLVYKGDDVDVLIRNHISRKIKEFIDSIPE